MDKHSQQQGASLQVDEDIDGPLSLCGTRLFGDGSRKATLMGLLSELQTNAIIGLLAQYGILLDGDFRENSPGSCRFTLVPYFAHNTPGEALSLIAERGRKDGLGVFKTEATDLASFFRDASWRFGMDAATAQRFVANLREKKA